MQNDPPFSPVIDHFMFFEFVSAAFSSAIFSQVVNRMVAVVSLKSPISTTRKSRYDLLTSNCISVCLCT